MTLNSPGRRLPGPTRSRFMAGAQAGRGRVAARRASLSDFANRRGAGNAARIMSACARPPSEARHRPRPEEVPHARGFRSLRAVHRQRAGRAILRREPAGDRPVRRARIRADRPWRDRRRRPCGARRAQGLRRHRHRTGHGALGRYRRGRARPVAAPLGRPGRVAPRRTGRDRIARHRQAAQPGARRCAGVGALFRVLRRGGRQAARPDDPTGTATRCSRCAGARRHGPHHPVELPDADLRPLG